MSEEKQGRIEFTLPMSQKSAYVRAARASGKKLVTWMLDALDKEAGIAPVSAGQLFESMKQQARTERYIEADDAQYFRGGQIESEAVRFRILVERAIIRKLVQDLLAVPNEAYAVSIHDGEDFAVTKTRDYAAIMEAIGETDEDRLYAYALDESGEYKKCVLDVYLVYGNDGYDVMADRNASPLADRLCAGADKLSDEFADLIRS